MEKADFDDILVNLGTGKWNILYFVGVSSCSFWLPAIILAGTYVSPATDFICDPAPVFTNVSEVNECTFVTGSNSSVTDDEGEIIEHKCTKWTYNQSDSTNSLTSEFNLVCDRAYLRPTYQMAYMIGNVVGSPINGVLSDRFGRRSIIRITSVLGILSVFVSFAFHKVVWIIVFRFVTGLCFHSLLLSSFTLFMEVCEPKHRSTAGILYTLPWAFGTIWWGFLGYMIRQWRWIQSASLAPMIITMGCICLYDESPRWLIINGRFEDALKGLEKASRWNKAKLPPDEHLLNTMNRIKQSSMLDRIPEDIDSDRSSLTKFFLSVKKLLYLIIVLFKTPKLRKITLLMYTVFFIAGNVYYGLSLNAANFNLDPYMYMVVVGATEIPAYAFTGHIIGRFGRVPPTVISFLLCGITVLLLTFLPKEPEWPVYLFAIVGTTTIAAAFQIIFLAATEVFPTEVRLQGFGTSSFLSSVGGGIAPFITESLGGLAPWAPSLVFGGLSSIAGIASCFIPETLNKHLPDTIEMLEGGA